MCPILPEITPTEVLSSSAILPSFPVESSESISLPNISPPHQPVLQRPAAAAPGRFAERPPAPPSPPATSNYLT